MELICDEGRCRYPEPDLPPLSRAAVEIFDRTSWNRASMDGVICDLQIDRAKAIADGYGIPWSGMLLDRLLLCESTVMSFRQKEQTAPETPQVEQDGDGWFTEVVN